MFTEFDSDAEYTTIRIIEQLSRYENVDDLAEDTVRSVLFNQALRQRMDMPEFKNNEGYLIKEAIIEENVKANEIAQLAIKKS